MEKEILASDFIPIIIQSLVALTFVAGTMIITSIIGGKRKRIRTLNKEENFECGLEVKGNARFPFSIQYFVVAILFVLFDVEVIFFYPWAVNSEFFGAEGFIGIFVYLVLFFVGFYYIVKKGALNWTKV